MTVTDPYPPLCHNSKHHAQIGGMGWGEGCPQSQINTLISDLNSPNTKLKPFSSQYWQAFTSFQCFKIGLNAPRGQSPLTKNNCAGTFDEGKCLIILSRSPACQVCLLLLNS